MEKIIKDFKSLSNFIGAMGVLQIINIISSYDKIMSMDITALNGMNIAGIGLPDSTLLSIVKAASFVPMVLGVLILFYLCIKGRNEANDPSPAKLHLVLAVICAVAYAFSTIDTLVNLFNGASDVLPMILEGLISGCSAVLMVYYFLYGKKIRTAE